MSPFVLYPRTHCTVEALYPAGETVRMHVDNAAAHK